MVIRLTLRPVDGEVDLGAGVAGVRLGYGWANPTLPLPLPLPYPQPYP